MRLDKPLFLNNHPIKEVPDPKDPQDAANRRYVDSKFASWSGMKDFIINQNNINEVLASVPRMGMGASIRFIINEGVYNSFKLAVIDYEFIEIYSNNHESISSFNLANRDLRQIKLRNLNGSHYTGTTNFINNRIIFSPDTVTTKLRYEVRQIVDQDKDIIILDEVLPVYPGEEDILLLETQGTRFNNFSISAGVLNTFYIEGIYSKSSNISLPYGKLDTYFCNFGDKL